LEYIENPTQTDLIIPANSNHPYNQKMAAFRSLTYRLLNYNLNKLEYEKEKNIIKTIARNNGYNPNIIDNIINKMSKKIKTNTEAITANPIPEPTPQKYVSIKYTDKISEKIGKAFKKSGYTPAYRVKSNPIPTYNITNPMKKERGVYKITCSYPCTKEYIGYTNRSFEQRFKEHNTGHHNNPTSIIAKHLKQNPTHSITFPNSLKILNKTHSKTIAKIQESYQIYKHINEYGPENLLNIREDYNNSIIFKAIHAIESSPHNLATLQKTDNTVRPAWKTPSPVPEPFHRLDDNSQNTNDDQRRPPASPQRIRRATPRRVVRHAQQ
jgi:predicted GIY-YIG superfamily endonuclease